MSWLNWEASNGGVEFQHAFVPALHAIHLRAIGPFHDVRVQFGKSLNFITGESCTGKSTFLWAIAAAVLNQTGPAWLRADVEAEITVELSGKMVGWACGGSDQEVAQSAPVGAGERNLTTLRDWIERSTKDHALLFDSDVFGCMDSRCLDEAFRLLASARGQIVTVLPTSLKVSDLAARKLKGRLITTNWRQGDKRPCMIEVKDLKLDGTA